MAMVVVIVMVMAMTTAMTFRTARTGHALHCRTALCLSLTNVTTTTTVEATPSAARSAEECVARSQARSTENKGHDSKTKSELIRRMKKPTSWLKGDGEDPLPGLVSSKSRR